MLPARQTPSDPSQAWLQRVNAAVDYVLANLDQPLKLETVAHATGLSPFHFHRVFRAAMGETLARFVKRVRLDRALSILTYEPRRPLTDVALACGFNSLSDFSRSFKQRFGVPPSAFDVQTFRRERREEWQAAVAEPGDRHRLARLPDGENPDGFTVELRRLPARRVAYVRVLDSFRPHAVERAIERMVAWAEQRGLAGGQWLGWMWDDPEITAAKDCRYDVGLEVARTFASAEVGCIDFPPMLIAQIEVRGPIDLEVRAIDWMFRTWMPASGYVPADQPSFEAWIGRPFAHGNEHFEILAQFPVERPRP